MPSAVPEPTRPSANGSAHARMIEADTMNSPITVMRRMRVDCDTISAAAPTNSSSSCDST